MRRAGGFSAASMTIREVWQMASKRLALHGFEDAQLEAELLLRLVLNVEQDSFYSGLGGTLSDSQLNGLDGLLEQRLGHKPGAYIRHSQEFYGLEFYVDERVLIPRPETELLVDKALDIVGAIHESPLLIADIGTGSGAIAVALAVKLPMAHIYAIDVSSQALEVARLNCQKHGVAERVELLQGDLMSPLSQRVDIIVANLPYVPDKDYADATPEVRQEPHIALSGGPDGLDYIRRLIDQAPAALLRPQRGALLLEVGIGQARAVAALMREYFSEVTVAKDLAGVERVVVGRR